MIYKMFTVFDSKVDEFMNPFFAKTTGEAIRIMADMCSNRDHQFNKYPLDFTLFELGTYDGSTGRADNLTAPQSICLLKDLIPSD